MNSFSQNETLNDEYPSYQYYTLNGLLTAYGYTPLLDHLNLDLITLVSFSGLVLNARSFVVFLDKEFSINLYSYLRVYIANNLLTCVLWIFNFTFSTKSLFQAISLVKFIPESSFLQLHCHSGVCTELFLQ
jgi:hypothetical protein